MVGCVVRIAWPFPLYPGKRCRRLAGAPEVGGNWELGTGNREPRRSLFLHLKSVGFGGNGICKLYSN